MDYSRPLRVRFSPPANGPLHAGAARTALFNRLLARRTGGTLVLQLDDRDGAAAEAALDADLRWLGIDIDEGPAKPADAGPYRRSERAPIYREHAATLLAAGRAFERDGALAFAIPAGRMVLDDLVRGRIEYPAESAGDVVIVGADGRATENFATAVDDALMGIDVVLRGEAQLDATPRQMLIQDALGFRSPRYGHLGTIVDDDDARAADRHEGTTIDAFRRRGYLPHALVMHLALLGWSPRDEREDLTLDELAREFSLERLGRANSAFNEPRLRAFNARELRALPPGALATMLAQAMQRGGLLEDPAPPAALRWIETFLEAYGSEIHVIADALPLVAELRAEAVRLPALELERLRNRQVIFFLDAVSQYVDAQPELRGLALSHDLPAIAEEFGIAKTDAFAAVRMALTGKHDGAPLTLLFPLLGHDRIMIRIGAVSSHLLHGRGLEPIRSGPGGVPFETILPERPRAT